MDAQPGYSCEIYFDLITIFYVLKFYAFRQFLSFHKMAYFADFKMAIELVIENFFGIWVRSVAWIF